jgi:hypothetical protein
MSFEEGQDGCAKGDSGFGNEKIERLESDPGVVGNV